MKLSTLGIIGCVTLFMVLPATGPVSAEDKLTASDEWSYDYFGYVTAIDGDTAVIGAHGNDDDGSNSGSAYIFQWDNVGGVWLEITKLTASDAAEQDKFGHTVTISGDIVVVGAYEDDDGSVDCGSAYVFYRDQGGADAWGEVVKLTASDGDVEDFLGKAIAVDDGRVIIGAYGDDGPMGLNSGSVYVFGTPFFADGFESGDTDMWDSTTP